MLMANNGCSRHHCSQWYLISSLSFSSLPLKANQQHMPYMRMVTCDDICAHIKCMKIWIAKHGLLHNAQEGDDTHWIPANHGGAKGALMPEKNLFQVPVGQRCTYYARWPKADDCNRIRVWKECSTTSFSLTVKKDVSKALSTEQPIWCWCLLRICQNWHLASMQLCFKVQVEKL